MSKAFTRESDESESYVLPVRAPLAPGVKNYITPAGAERLRAELAALEEASPMSEKPHWREARLRQLHEIVGSLVIAEPVSDKNTIRFGATVTLLRGNETEKYRLVGIDETDINSNEISWLSPLGKVLLGQRVGTRVSFRSPSGLEELRIVSIAYPGK